MESAICKWNPHFVCSDFHLYLRIPHTFCGFHLHFAKPLTVAESRTTSYICLLQNPQQHNCADKTYVTATCTRNPEHFCKWNPFTFWNMFKDLSLESRNIHPGNCLQLRRSRLAQAFTQNCAPIQCTVWPRNVINSKKKLRLLSFLDQV